MPFLTQQEPLYTIPGKCQALFGAVVFKQRLRTTPRYSAILFGKHITTSEVLGRSLP